MKRLCLDLHARHTVLTLGHETKIMGIVNCTPDSFSGDGRRSTQASLRHALRLLAEGADILDVGGESTRPGALKVPVDEELKRVVPVVRALARRCKIPISVDTSKIEVARRALDNGAAIVNNIRAGSMSRDFLRLVRDHRAAIVIMHMRGSPSTMQRHAHYRHVVDEVLKELRISVEKCLEIGIKKNNIIIDVGIGFAKGLHHNLLLINQLDRFNVLRLPILLGTSRKSFLGTILHQDVEDRLMGTAASVSAGVMRGAHMVRVHDVKAIKETLKVTDAILNARD
jgi:dihydropteroate synthase